MFFLEEERKARRVRKEGDARGRRVGGKFLLYYIKINKKQPLGVFFFFFFFFIAFLEPPSFDYLYLYFIFNF